MTEFFNKTREFVKESFNNEAQMLHFDRTVHWVQVFKPDPDEGLLIAAVAHDIQRAFSGSFFVQSESKFTDKDHIKTHQEQGAEIMKDFLKKLHADSALIERVAYLISKHEVGGDSDQNILRDADSLSFLENNAEIFLSRLDKLGYEKIKEKFDWMYSRITNAKRKELAKPYYEKMTKRLNSEVSK